jgi:2,3-bisphosphoglycerate-independent phosphoglycerate mutase
MKYILIIGDGMADNPVEELGGITPLQSADIPQLDAMASAGIMGSAKTCPEGMPPGSDTAIMSIFGCDPRKYYTGRAPLEAAATGISLMPGDVAYRCNMVAYEDADLPFAERRILSHSAGSIDGETSAALAVALFDDPGFKAEAGRAGMKICPARSFRHIAVQSGADIAGISLKPPHDHLGEQIADILPSGCANADVLRALMERAFEFLDHHELNEKRRAEGKLPANGVWFWAEGTAVALPDFMKRYGKTGGVISAVPLCHGIASLVNLRRVSVEGATGELDTNYEGKAQAAIDLLRECDFAAIHVEAPDECTHNGDLQGKLEAIRRLDARTVAPLLRGLADTGWEYRILVLSDHKTLTSTRGHDGTPVPFLIYDSRSDGRSGASYCEADGERGEYVGDGTRLMDMLFETP